MRDHLFPESVARQTLRRKLTDLFGRWGYELVTTPPFEHAEVLERGLDTLDRRDLLRFVEPDTGEVALLRPDITPQVARVVATRLEGRPPPFRLCYEGWVIRQRRGRVRRPRQVAQAGVEHVGVAGPEADAEILTLCCHALRELGLSEFRIELAHSRIVREALSEAPREARAGLSAAVGAKDGASLDFAADRHSVASQTRQSLEVLAGLWGELDDTIARARASAIGERAGVALDELVAVSKLLPDDLRSAAGLDLGEHRGMAYYTGVSFSVLCDGPGQPVGAGGRYDNLLSRFGLSSPATGFALDVDAIEAALQRAGRSTPGRAPRVAVHGGDRSRRGEALSRLRERACACDLADVDEQTAVAFAAAWHYDAVLSLSDGASGRRSVDRARRPVDLDNRGLAAFVEWITQV